LAAEFIFMYTMLAVGVVSGLTALRQAMVTELTECANSIMSLSQSYSFSGQSNALAWTAGSSAVDSSGSISGARASAAAPAISHVPCE
jgi:hypothetical protein